MTNLNKDQRIYSASYISVMCILVFSSFIGTTAYLLFQRVRQNAVLVSIFGMIIGSSILFLYLILKKNMKDMNIIEYNKFVFGNFFGNIINMIIGLSLFFIASVFLQNIANFINTNYLIDTSILYVKILLLCPVIYAASQKVTIISNISLIIVILNILVIIVSFFGMQSQLKFERIYPLISCGYEEFFNSSFVYVIGGMFLIFLLSIISKKERYEDESLSKKLVISYFIANICCIIVIFFTVAVLGEDLIYIYDFPEYFITQEFSLFSIIERVENTLCLTFIFNSFFTLSFIVYFISKSIRDMFNLDLNKTEEKIQKNRSFYFVIPMIIAIFLLIFTTEFYTSPVKLNEIIEKYYIKFILFTFIFPMISTVIFGRLKKREKYNA